MFYAENEIIADFKAVVKDGDLLDVGQRYFAQKRRGFLKAGAIAFEQGDNVVFGQGQFCFLSGGECLRRFCR